MRRLSSTSLAVGKFETEALLIECMENLTGSGRLKEWKKMVLKSTIIGYTRILKLCNDGQERRNRFGTDIYVKERFQ